MLACLLARLRAFLTDLLPAPRRVALQRARVSARPPRRRTIDIHGGAA